MKLPKSLTTVTPFSKAVALALFIILPFFWYFVGSKAGERKGFINSIYSQNIPQRYDYTDIKKIIDVTYLDPNTKAYITKKFGITWTSEQTTVFIADRNLDPKSIKVLDVVKNDPANNRYTDIYEYANYIVVHKSGNYSGDIWYDLAIFNPAGEIITNSIWSKNPEYKGWTIEHIHSLYGSEVAMIIYNFGEYKNAFVEMDLRTGLITPKSFKDLGTGYLNPNKYYPSQLGKNYTFGGYDYTTVAQPSMNIVTDGKSTNYSGILRKISGTQAWSEYIQILSLPANAKNNPYKIIINNSGLHILIVDQNGGGSGEGQAKLIKVNQTNKTYTTEKCFYYIPEEKYENMTLDELLKIKGDDLSNPGCSNYKLEFIEQS